MHERESAGGRGLDPYMVQQVDKDVVRTDRSNPYYRGEGNQHIALLRCEPVIGRVCM